VNSASSPEEQIQTEPADPSDFAQVLTDPDIQGIANQRANQKLKEKFSSG